MNIAAEIARAVEARASGRCEYCRMHHSLQGATFHVEHIVPRCKGGDSQPGNLAWCFPSCNLHKADRVEFTDPVSGGVASLFNPRQMHWEEHFEWDGFRLNGRTPVGRATAAALDLNHPRRLRIREAEGMFGLFPP